ncbi:MAG TPA: clan AA aspartic protease [Terriglobia bacterium]
MGLIYTKIFLGNPWETELKQLEVEALVDTGSMLLCIPEHVALQLRLNTAEEREVTIADGSIRLCRYVGPIEVRFDGRTCFAGALILGDRVLLGAGPMEDINLVINPLTRTVQPNPKSPNIPSTIVMASWSDGRSS